ncbi:hypothetical protein Bca4012_080525 [Brassica carinata]
MAVHGGRACFRFVCGGEEVSLSSCSRNLSGEKLQFFPAENLLAVKTRLDRRIKYAWIPDTPQEVPNDEAQAISLDNICTVDVPWISIAQFSGCGWVWKDSLRQIQLMGMRNFSRRESVLHSEVEALKWAMESMLLHSSCQSFGTYCKDLIAMIRELQALPSFVTELETIKMLELCFLEFKISHIPRAQNGIFDSLAKSARLFHMKLCYIGCSIPVWLPIPPQVL